VITPDLRLVHASYCPRCDAGEPAVETRARDTTGSLDAETFWSSTAGSVERTLEQPVREPADPSPAPVRAARGSQKPGGIDLWWEGGPDEHGKHRAADGLDARWAMFAPSDDGEDDEFSSKGSFSFAVDEPVRRRRSRFGLPIRSRQPV
jgi:hypothetical protein